MQIKKQLNHELSNLLSYIQLTVSDSDMDAAEKNNIQRWIKIATLFIFYENLFSGRKLHFFKKDENIKPILEIVTAINKPEFVKKKIAFKSQVQDFKANIDSFLFRDAIDLLFKYLISKSTSILLETYAKGKTISIKSEAVKEIKKSSLAKSLVRENLQNTEILLQLALELFKRQRISVKIDRDRMILKL